MKSLFLFINPAIQGPARMYRAMSRSKIARRAAYGMVAAGFINGMISMMLSDDDEDIQDYRKNTRVTYATPSGNQVTVFYLPYGYNTFWAMGRYMAEVAMGQKTAEEAAKATGLAALDSFNPLGGSRFALTETVPSAAKPLFEIHENTGWHGGQIHPEQPFFQAKVPNNQLYWSNVSNFSKFTATQLNNLTGGNAQKSGIVDLSPEDIDYAIAQYTGGVGQFLQNVFETGTALVTDAELKRNTIPIVRDYYTEIDTVRAKQSVIYPMIEESRRTSFDENETDRFHKAINQLEEVGEIDATYAEELRTRFRENQHFVETGEDFTTSSVRNGLERIDEGENVNTVVAETTREIYGADYETRNETRVRKLMKLHQVFGFEDEQVKELQEARSNDTRADILLNMKKSMGDDAFMEFMRKGRTNYTTASGRTGNILISDDLLETYREKERAGN